METFAAVASAVIAGLAGMAAVWGWQTKRREEQLRRDDVLAWAMQSIEALQSIVVICRISDARLHPAVAKEMMQAQLFRTSVLVEQGRLFFKNVPKGSFGSDKPEAYRGLRPLILDHLVMGHEIACSWPDADELARAKLGFLAEKAARSFVSTVRTEVGRERSASDGAAKEGSGVWLSWQMKQISPEQLKEAKWL